MKKGDIFVGSIAMIDPGCIRSVNNADVERQKATTVFWGKGFVDTSKGNALKYQRLVVFDADIREAINTIVAQSGDNPRQISEATARSMLAALEKFNLKIEVGKTLPGTVVELRLHRASLDEAHTHTVFLDPDGMIDPLSLEDIAELGILRDW